MISCLISCLILHDIISNVIPDIMSDFLSDILHVFQVVFQVANSDGRMLILKHKVLMPFCLPQRKSLISISSPASENSKLVDFNLLSISCLSNHLPDLVISFMLCMIPVCSFLLALHSTYEANRFRSDDLAGLILSFQFAVDCSLLPGCVHCASSMCTSSFFFRGLLQQQN
jgi:hypothetical protein